ncbi:winged helix-turn-helix transcriptional regulator [Nonomuraea sp. CA-141351]|uniref:winged helix-turn-helix transcriptional regulator n=1 Tax=Nonomuraea sp. CA-141351 TaxID=3239996 RepID=UPI003D8E39C7
MLSQTLRSLTADGLVSRRVEPTVPPRTWYSLTVLGRTLDDPLAAVRAWAEGLGGDAQGDLGVPGAGFGGPYGARRVEPDGQRSPCGPGAALPS